VLRDVELLLEVFDGTDAAAGLAVIVEVVPLPAADALPVRATAATVLPASTNAVVSASRITRISISSVRSFG
jgi:hypothetical protein